MLDAGNAYNALCLMLLVGQQTLLRLIFLRFKSPFLSMRGSCGQWASLLEGVSDVQPCLVSCCLVPLVITRLHHTVQRWDNRKYMFGSYH